MTGMAVFRFPDGRTQWRSPVVRRYRVGDSFEHDGERYRVCAVEDRRHDDPDDTSEELSGFIQAVTQGAGTHGMQGVWAYTAP